MLREFCGLSPVRQKTGSPPWRRTTKCPLLRFLRFSCALVVVCLLSGNALAGVVNIDTFNLGSAQAAIFGAGTTTGAETIVNPPIAETIGGVRGYTATGQGPGTGVTTLAVLGGNAGFGTLSMVAPYSGQWTLRYGYNLAGAPADLNANLLGSGPANNAVLIKMVSAEYAYDLDVTMTTNGVSSTVSVTEPANLNPQDVLIPFSSFSGVNFQDIDQISVRLTGRPDGDYTMDAIMAVPEPATLMVLAAGGLLALRRKRA